MREWWGHDAQEGVLFGASYDAKRDRWNGYDPLEHEKIHEEYEARRSFVKRRLTIRPQRDLAAAVRKVAKAGKEEAADPDFGSSDEEDADDVVGQKLDTKTRITVRNLRIREDTAKYLVNLDPDSAYYDPKTRSMRDTPLNNVAPEDVRHFLPSSRLFLTRRI